MTVPDADHLVQAAEAAADVAGVIIRPFFRATISAEHKRDASPVTIADRTAEQAVRAVLAQRYPSFGILGEEYGLERPDAPWRWVVDPIDGTRAFITGRPVFGTLIALLNEATPVLGVIDQPITGERWIGVSGRPTTFRGPFGGQVGGRACHSLADAELSATSPDVFGSDDAAAWGRVRRAVRRTTFGGDCYAYGLLALGMIDVIVEAGMQVWDWAALVPVVEGAGGRITDWGGAPLRADGDGRVLATGNHALLDQAVSCLTSSLLAM